MQLLRLPAGCAERKPLVDGELDEFCVALEPELLHHAVFVKGDRPGCNVQDARRLLHRISFREQLKHLSLA